MIYSIDNRLFFAGQHLNYYFIIITLKIPIVITRYLIKKRVENYYFFFYKNLIKYSSESEQTIKIIKQLQLIDEKIA